MPNIRLTDESYKKLKAHKEKTGISIQFLLKQAIDYFLAKKQG